MRRKGNAVDGVLLLDKPLGVTSTGALQQARRLFNAAKAGHTGTLDPMATGLLPLCFGEATKFSGLLLDAHKTYLARIVLGVVTTTGDAEGEVVQAKYARDVDAIGIHDVLHGLVGPLDQVPPMYSALKHRGRPLYEYARAGQEIARSSRRVTIFSLEIVRLELPAVEIRVEVSKGTYIRSLAVEIGERMGCGGHLGALRREAVGTFSLDSAITLEKLGDLSHSECLAQLSEPDVLLAGIPRVDLDEPNSLAVRHGRPAEMTTTPVGLVRLYDPSGSFLGVGEAAEGGAIAPRRMLNTA